MNEIEARKILKDYIDGTNLVWAQFRNLQYIDWCYINDKYANKIVLDGEFTAEELEAIAFWVRMKHE